MANEGTKERGGCKSDKNEQHEVMFEIWPCIAGSPTQLIPLRRVLFCNGMKSFDGMQDCSVSGIDMSKVVKTAR